MYLLLAMHLMLTACRCLRAVTSWQTTSQSMSTLATSCSRALLRHGALGTV